MFFLIVSLTFLRGNVAMKPAACHGALIRVDIDILGSIYFVGLVDF